MKTWLIRSGVFFAIALCAAGCYQVHSDDDLRTIPVTNNPNIVPARGPQMPMSTM